MQVSGNEKLIIEPIVIELGVIEPYKEKVAPFKIELGGQNSKDMSTKVIFRDLKGILHNLPVKHFELQ